MNFRILEIGFSLIDVSIIQLVNPSTQLDKMILKFNYRLYKIVPCFFFLNWRRKHEKTQRQQKAQATKPNIYLSVKKAKYLYLSVKTMPLIKKKLKQCQMFISQLSLSTFIIKAQATKPNVADRLAKIAHRSDEELNILSHHHLVIVWCCWIMIVL